MLKLVALLALLLQAPQSAQAAFAQHVFGTLTWGGQSNCIWSNASSGWNNYAADTDCAAPTTTGALSAPATNVPGFKVASLPKGKYLIIASGFMDSTGNITCVWRLHDGTNAAVGFVGFDGGTYPAHSLTGLLTVSSNQTNVTVQIQNNNVSAASACRLLNYTANHSLTFVVIKM
jgi:hypothetical protein